MLRRPHLFWRSLSGHLDLPELGANLLGDLGVLLGPHLRERSLRDPDVLPLTRAIVRRCRALLQRSHLRQRRLPVGLRLGWLRVHERERVLQLGALLSRRRKRILGVPGGVCGGGRASGRLERLLCRPDAKRERGVRHGELVPRLWNVLRRQHLAVLHRRAVLPLDDRRRNAELSGDVRGRRHARQATDRLLRRNDARRAGHLPGASVLRRVGTSLHLSLGLLHERTHVWRDHRRAALDLPCHLHPPGRYRLDERGLLRRPRSKRPRRV